MGAVAVLVTVSLTGEISLDNVNPCKRRMVSIYARIEHCRHNTVAVKR